MACLAQLGSSVPLYALIALRQQQQQTAEDAVGCVGAVLLRPTAVIKFNNANVIKSLGQLQNPSRNSHRIEGGGGREGRGRGRSSNVKCTHGNALSSPTQPPPPSSCVAADCITWQFPCLSPCLYVCLCLCNPSSCWIKRQLISCCNNDRTYPPPTPLHPSALSLCIIN